MWDSTRSLKGACKREAMLSQVCGDGSTYPNKQKPGAKDFQKATQILTHPNKS